MPLSVNDLLLFYKSEFSKKLFLKFLKTIAVNEETLRFICFKSIQDPKIKGFACSVHSTFSYLHSFPCNSRTCLRPLFPHIKLTLLVPLTLFQADRFLGILLLFFAFVPRQFFWSCHFDEHDFFSFLSFIKSNFLLRLKEFETSFAFCKMILNFYWICFSMTRWIHFFFLCYLNKCFKSLIFGGCS